MHVEQVYKKQKQIKNGKSNLEQQAQNLRWYSFGNDSYKCTVFYLFFWVNVFAPSNVYSLLPRCMYPRLPSCICVFHVTAMHANSSDLRVGVTTLLNTIQYNTIQYAQNCPALNSISGATERKQDSWTLFRVLKFVWYLSKSANFVVLCQGSCLLAVCFFVPHINWRPAVEVSRKISACTMFWLNT